MKLREGPVHPLTMRQREKLLHDFDLGGKVFETDESARATWEEHRQELMELWFEKEPPGTRPWGWWEFDRPADERRRLGGVGTPSRDRGAACPAWARGSSYGTPSVYEDDYDSSNPPKFESEETYLRRHGLLTQREKRILARGQNSPKPSVSSSEPGRVMKFQADDDPDAA